MDYRFNRKQGTPFILEADSEDEAWEKFFALDGNSGVCGTKQEDITDVEQVTNERPARNLNGVLVR